MKLTSKKVSVQKPASEICEYMSQVKNYKELMPENINKFEVLGDNSFIFGLKGMPEIALEVKEIEKPNKVVLGAMDSKFPFTLTGNIIEESDQTSTVEFLFEGEFNAMMAMMIKGPISKFMDTLASNLERL